MSQHSDSETEIEIQNTLALINDVTLNIKKELMVINELVRENGRLNTAAHDTNEILSRIAGNAGRKTNEERKAIEGGTDIENNLNESVNVMMPLSSNSIIDQLNAIIKAHP